MPATEAVYSGVHPCLERAQRGDGSGEEVHSEVSLAADRLPTLACEPAFLSTPEPRAPLMPGEKPLVCKGPECLLSCECPLGPPSHVQAEELTCCVTLSQLLYHSDPVSSTQGLLCG